MIRQSRTMELGMDLINLNLTIECLERENAELALKGAMYKAYFFHKDGIVKALQRQIERNLLFREHKSLEDMVIDGLLSEKEYEFCIL